MNSLLGTSRWLAAVLVVSLTAACSSGNVGREEHVPYLMDYPYYASSAELADQADLVAEVTLHEKARVERMFPRQVSAETDPRLNPEVGAAEPQRNNRVDDGLVITVHVATIERVHKGTAKPGEKIEVKELGGRLDGVTYELENAVPLQGGERYLLFLATFPDSPASLLNPQQGQYAVDAGGAFRPLGGNKVSVTAADLARVASR